MNAAAWIWLALIVAFIVLEAATAQLVSMWFIGGSVASFIVALFGLGVGWQIVVFLVVSGVMLIALRPLVKRKVTPISTPTNADMSIGRVAVVRDEINNEKGEGRVMLDGQDWAARSYYGDILPAGSRAVVYAIDGVKLIVMPLAQENQ